MASAQNVAKISTPKLQAWIARDRLFQILDFNQSRKIIWVSAPAGAGKTSLVSSYLDSRQSSALWYQLDESDEDQASFFFYLGLAVKNTVPNELTSLPILSPEYLPGLATFNRNYFRELGTALERIKTLVFDNYQDIPDTAALHGLLATGIAELPDDFTVIIISRSNPPPSYARIQTQQGLSLLNWDDLRLTAEETKEICKRRLDKKFTEEEVQKLYTKTQGWVTGLVLLLEQVKDLQIPPNLEDQKNCQLLFDYFSEEIFLRMDDEIQGFLLKTALLPTLTLTMAERLSGMSQAEVILNDLVNRNYFTLKRSGQPTNYEYHPLFREFLLSRLRQTQSHESLEQLQRQAAELLREKDYIDAAADILQELEDWESLIGLILSNAQTLVESGSFQTLRTRLNALPAPLFEQVPWLSFWLGVAYQPVDLLKSRSHLQQAFEAFKASGDAVGSYLAWASAIDTFLYVWGDFHSLDYWIDQFLEIHERWPDYPSPEIEGKATFGMFAALMWRQPEHTEFSLWRERAEDMLHRDIDPSYRMMSGSYLLFYYIWWQGNLNKAGLLMDMVRPYAGTEGINPLAKLMWKYMESAYAAATNAYADCIKAVDQGLQIAQESGVYVMNFTLHAKAVYGALGAGKVEVMDQHLKQMAGLINEVAYFDRAHYHFLCSWHALIDGDLPRAKEQAEYGLTLSEQSGGSICCPFLSLAMAQVLLEQGDNEQADNYLRVAEDWGESVGSTNIISHSLYTRAYAYLIKAKNDEVRGLSVLREALAFAKTQGHTSHPWIVWRRDVMLQLFIKALEHNIEVDYVRDVIRQRHLIPEDPPLHLENWPWSVKIYTLGRFSLLKDNEAIHVSGKGQKKPLELLMVLIAFSGREVGKEKLIEALWPDTEGDLANKNFDTTLYRLRKLLGQKVLLLRDGHLSLNPRYVWVDVWAFERQLSAMEHLLTTGDCDIESVQRSMQYLLDMYHGNFLRNEDEAAWMLRLRERLKYRWLRICKRLIHELGQAGYCEQAIELYQKMIELDDLAEEYYRGLMTCYAAQGLRSEAIAVYGRCQTMLNVILGMKPSAETIHLFETIKHNDKNDLGELCLKCHAINRQYLHKS